MSSSYVPPSVANVSTSQNAVEASTFAKDTAADIQRNINERSWSLRLLALLAGLAMIVTSVLGFVGYFFTLRLVAALFKIYVFFLGIVVVSLESGRRLTLFSGLEDVLYRSAPFLK